MVNGRQQPEAFDDHSQHEGHPVPSDKPEPDHVRVVQACLPLEPAAEHHLVTPTRRPGGRRIARRHRLGRALGMGRRVLAFQRDQVLLDRAPGPLLVRPIDLGPLDSLETAGKEG